MGFDGAVPATGASGRADHVAISVSGGADRPVHAHHSEDFVGQVVARLGYGPEVVAAAAARASINRTSVISEILAHGRISEAEFYRAVADSLGIDYRDKVDPDRIVLSERDGLALLRQPAIRLVR